MEVSYIFGGKKYKTLKGIYEAGRRDGSNLVDRYEKALDKIANYDGPWEQEVDPLIKIAKEARQGTRKK